MIQACIDFMNIDIVQFRQHSARADEQNANLDHYFWRKSEVFVEVNGPLSSVKFYQKMDSVLFDTPCRDAWGRVSVCPVVQI